MRSDPGTRSTAERDQTDAGLRAERARTDRALAERLAAVEDDASRVVSRARDDADAVLSAARDKADRRLEADAQSVEQAAVVVAEERAREDEVLRRERAAADEALRRQRDENLRALLKLLPLEREQTDDYLMTERVHSDVTLSHRDDFLGMVSHDLRNLLGGIVLAADAVATEAVARADPQRIAANVERIQRSAAWMSRLIGDLLDVARIDAGSLAVAPVPGDAAVLVDEVVDAFHAQAVRKGVTLRADGAGSLPCVFDHDRLLQVLANLVTNAVKFTPVGGAVRVGCERNADRVVFRVTDTGTGIPASSHDAIFERFWQGDDVHRRGVGLGLFISKHIVQLHGGTIRVESAPGSGSTFHVSLPLDGRAA